MVARCKFTEGKHGKSSHEVLAGAGRRPKTENLDPLDLSCERCSRDHDRLSEECQALIFKIPTVRHTSVKRMQLDLGVSGSRP